MPLTLMYITNSPEIALIAEKNGVERIWIDLETLGKEERQKNMNAVLSHHTIHDIEVVSKLLTKSELMVRINPWNENSVNEIEQVIAAGANRIMLPMWKSVSDVSNFLKVVCGRVKTTLLLETKEAEECLDGVLKLQGIDEIHIGLNDLHLSYGLAFMFELLSNGTVERICKRISAAGIPYGFGGIARIGEGTLPAERIIIEHYRLGSTRVILSRSFCNAEKVTDISEIDTIFSDNIKKLREYEEQVKMLDPTVLVENSEYIKQCIAEIVKGGKKK